MNLFADALVWLTDSANWSGTSGIPYRTGRHIAVAVFVVVVTSLIAIPTGVVVGHTGRGAGVVGAIAGGLRAIPTLGLLTLLGLALGIGLQAPVLALIILAFPSLLAGAYSGIGSVDPAVTEAARAMGMSPAQVLATIELPLALPIIVGGVRAASLQVIATVTLAAYMSDTGLGRYLFTGLKSRDYPQMLGGAILVLLLAAATELVLAVCQRLAARLADPARRATPARVVATT